jgi:hypothetical protein
MNSSMFRRQPLNYNNHPRTVGPHNVGILFGVRPTPPQYGGNNDVASLHEFRRAPSTFSAGKWRQVGSSSDVIASKKRAAIGRGTLYSTDGAFSTKRQSINDVRQSIRRMRSS